MLVKNFSSAISRFGSKAIFVVLLVLLLFGWQPLLASAQEAALTNYGLDQARGFGLGTYSLVTIIGNIVRVILGILGILLVLIILYAGWLWMTSAGDVAKITKAKKTITNAVIGLIIIFSAFAIVSFIINALTGGRNGNISPHPGGANDWGRSGLGVGPIQSVYPEPGQTEVPINTWIAVTFKEDVDPASICDKDKIVDGRCQNSPMKNVEICQLDANNKCVSDGDFSVSNLADTAVTNKDKKTFVFTPNNNKYLGLEDFQDREFMVTLKAEILRDSDKQSIFSNLSDGQYVWSFTTNGELDLDPPEILSGGVYPNPDDDPDTYSQSLEPQPTKFGIAVDSFINIKSEEASRHTSPAKSGNSPRAILGGQYAGSASGLVMVTVASDGQQVTVVWPGDLPNYVSSYAATSTTIDIGPYGLTFNLEGVAVGGNSWMFEVTAAQTGDSIKLMEGQANLKTYVIGRDIVLAVGETAASLLQKLADKIITDNSSVLAACGAGCVQTRETGVASGRYSFQVSSAGLSINKTSSGTDKTDKVTDIGASDVYRNTIFQINFNEAVNPLIIDQIVVEYYSGGTDLSALELYGTTTSVDYKAEISNQYRTLEIVGPEECGVNSCGDKIYCWPINNKIKSNPNDLDNKATYYFVKVKAATLINSTNPLCSRWGGGALSKDSYNRCGKVVGGLTVFYPAAKDNDGVLDMSGNSFNGSFNTYQQNDKTIGIAEGQSASGSGHSGKQYYDLNRNINYGATSDYGDDFFWSFYVSDKIDTQAPLLQAIGPEGWRGNETLSNLSQDGEMTFDRLMRSATLKPGWNYGSDARSRSIRYVALNTLTAKANPVGYWISNANQDLNGDNWPDNTVAYINHNNFDRFIKYGSLAGSGVQSITQNCFLPSAGPAGAGSGSCQYNGGVLIGCEDVSLPNPASYSQTACAEIPGAQVCAASQICKVLYYDSTKAETDLAGSWVLSQDQQRRADDETATGCCLGKCVNR